MNKNPTKFNAVCAFGPGTLFHHAGLAVTAIPSGVEAVYDPIQKVHVAFVSLNGFLVEFVAPADEQSPVKQCVLKGQKFYHLCFETDDIELALKNGRAGGFHCIARPVPAAAFDGRKIAWVFSSVYGLVELVERGNAPNVE